MTVNPQEIAKWREAHQNPKGQNIYVPEEGLATVAPFPSLYASDFLVYLEAKGTDPQVVSFVRELSREMEWTYGGWAKAQNDGDPGKLLDSMLNEATSVADADYTFVRRFLTDYAKAHGIRLSSEAAAAPPWMMALEPGPAQVAQGTGQGSIGDQPIFPAAKTFEAGPTVTAPPPPLPELTGADHVDR